MSTFAAVEAGTQTVVPPSTDAAAEMAVAATFDYAAPDVAEAALPAKVDSRSAMAAGFVAAAVDTVPRPSVVAEVHVMAFALDVAGATLAAAFSR
ncbi:hypothetical protein HDU96_005953 [Phlyctochytrium bullatum]|nr:hypothetical protein HDU96_005953 [Phlyctochytrium bullatum]